MMQLPLKIDYIVEEDYGTDLEATAALIVVKYIVDRSLTIWVASLVIGVDLLFYESMMPGSGRGGVGVSTACHSKDVVDRYNVCCHPQKR
jgi:hypothetical protein